MTAEPRVAFFDMDHTLIDNDCDVSWKEFLVAEGLAPASELGEVRRFYDLYVQTRLPVAAFNAFQLRQFSGRSIVEMMELTHRHFERCVRDRVFPEARRAIEEHRAAGRCLVLLTATNRPVATPLAEYLGLDDVIATEMECVDGRYTGRIGGVYCVKEGKVTLSGAWCQKTGHSLSNSVYYGDSLSDVPMLEAVGQAVCVNPGEGLERIAAERGWAVLRWTR